ncbi:MAG: ABC transporter substrate-binding protein [Bdellovibrionales bacterium]|nr:ABC transporter substrate-binding protein [Bdellovibrionales bacterium]
MNVRRAMTLRDITRPVRECVLLIAFLVYAFGIGVPEVHAECDRIVSLAPSITEILLSLGLKEQIVGVSVYDSENVETHGLPVVGDLFSLSSERVVSLRPDIAFVLEEQRLPQKNLADLQIPPQVVDHRTVTGIHDSIRAIGRVCRRQQQAKQILAQLQDQVSFVQKQYEIPKHGRVLVLIGDSEGMLSTKRFFVSGRDGFYSGLLTLLGLTPAFRETTRGFHALTPEQVLSLRPDYIFHVMNPGSNVPSSVELQRIWRDFPNMPAVVQKHLYATNQAYFSTPGISYPKVLRDLAQVIYRSSSV